MSGDLTIPSRSVAGTASFPANAEPFMRRLGPVDSVSDFFAYPVVLANQGATAGSFGWSRLFYFTQIFSSILGIVGTIFGGIGYGLRDLARREGKNALVSFVGIPRNTWMHTKLLVGSAFGLVAPLPINRTFRGVEKQIPQVKRAPPGPGANQSESFIDTVISLALDFCCFAKWTRQS